MDWIANHWMLLLAVAYAAASEIIGMSRLKANSVVQAGMQLVGKVIVVMTRV